MHLFTQIKKSLEIFKTISIDHNDNQTLELEIRLGKYNKNRFIPGIPEISFKKILNSFQDWKTTTIDETIFKDIPEKQRKNIGWILKDSLFKYDDKQENLRISLNLETLYTFKEVLERHNANNESFSKSQIQLFRKKTRHSKIFGNWQLDLTQVDVYKIDNGNWVKQNIVYECEIEMIKYNENFQDIWNIIAPIHYGSIIFPYYSSLVKANKFIGNQPKTLEKENMHLLTIDYMVTEKADGQRMFLFGTKRGTFLIDNQLNAIRYNLSLPEGTLIDGEYINGKFLAFDCLFYKGSDKRKLNLIERLDIMKNISITIKTFMNIKECKNVWNKTYDYKLDGLIFTPKYQDYSGSILKWKPDHTMDVYVDNEFNIYAWSGKEKKNVLVSSFFKPTSVVETLQTTPNIITNAIIELDYDSIDHVWYQKCVRKDKTKPNAILTVQGVIKAITENITLEDILTSLESNYQTPGKTNKERNTKIDINYRKFHNKVKNYLINFPDENNRKFLLDLGCGKGGDIMKWINAGYTDVLAIDNSHTHLYGPNGFAERYEKVKNKINITFVWGDVTKSLKECGLNEQENDKLKPWLKTKFDIVSCQFAIHYFLNDKITWTIFMKNVQTHIKNGGYFVGTYLNAHNLKELNSCHEFKINGETFYTLKHTNPLYTEYSQQIIINRYNAFWKAPRQKLIIHTSEWDNEIEENVIFPEHLVILMKGKFHQVEDKSFETLVKKYEIKLTKDEQLLSSLHNYFIYQF